MGTTLAFLLAFIVFTSIAEARRGSSVDDPAYIASIKQGLRGIRCPCSNASLCEPLQNTPEKELIGFSANVPASVYHNFDWSQMTTIMVTDCTDVLRPNNCPPWDPQLVCYAHQRGVRVIRWPLSYNNSILTNYTLRLNWIQSEITLTKGRFWDGINLDWELGMAANDTESQLRLTEFVNDVATVFRLMIPGSKISFDVPFSPYYPETGKCVFQRCFDYAGLSSVLDYFFVMDYDVYVWGEANCHSYPNAPHPEMIYGLLEYSAVGVDPKKLIAGLPWYGYFYKYCILPPNITSCPLPYYSNGNCIVDQSRYEVTYQSIVSTWMPMATKLGGGRKWDNSSSSPYLYWFDESGANLHHLWYDDVDSLAIKINSLRNLTIGGIGMFALTEIDLSNATQVRQMWAPFNSYMNDSSN